MIGILVVTHGGFGEGLLESAKLIAGNFTCTQSIGLYHGDGIEEFKSRIRTSIEELDTGDGVLVLIDLFGGSPSNVVALNMVEFTEKHQLACITGVNFPIVLEAILTRDSYCLDMLSEHCFTVGKESIKDLYKKLREVKASL